MCSTSPEFEVVVVGAGPGGIATGVELKKNGIENFLIVERSHQVGGSFRDNTYPGVGVDVPSFAYQFSFARNGNWSRVFAKGAEVQKYHVDVFHQHGLDKHIRYDTEVVREVWDEDRALWVLHTRDGEITTRFLITAVGAFLRPQSDSGIPGASKFKGKLQRPDNWDHSYDYTGKRVAVVGTGASSVQITPEMARDAEHVTVYQRTPIYCWPKPDGAVPVPVQKVLGLPGVMFLMHGVFLLIVEVGSRGLVFLPAKTFAPGARVVDNATKALYRRYLRLVVKDKKLVDALTPSHGVISKRPALSNGFLQSFTRDNVELVTESIETLTADGVRTVDGVERPTDMVVLATGYEMFTDPESYQVGTVVGRDGFDMSEYFTKNGLQSYEGVAILGLPNRWMIVGPYSLMGTGWHGLVEINARFAVRAIAEARARNAAVVEVREDAYRAWFDEVRKRDINIRYYFKELHKGFRTYYVNSQGEMPYVRPFTIFEAMWRSRHSPLDDYTYEQRPARRVSAKRIRVVRNTPVDAVQLAGDLA